MSFVDRAEICAIVAQLVRYPLNLRMTDYSAEKFADVIVTAIEREVSRRHAARISAGMRAAAARGNFVRRRFVNEELRAKIVAAARGRSYQSVAEEFCVSPSTVMRYWREADRG
jgi:DNA invertase Pin-like site-specific DNA recombinase